MATFEAPPRQRSPWVWVAAGCGGLLILGVLACVAFAIVGGFAARKVADQVEAGATHSWSETASRTDLQVYEPGYLPRGAGTPEIMTFGLGSALQTVAATYPGGLQILEVNRNEGSNARREVTVRGAERAYIADSGALVVRKGSTWITLDGLPEDALIRIAESLRQVQ
jgi:hypothetical protein